MNCGDLERVQSKVRRSGDGWGLEGYLLKHLACKSCNA